MSKICKHKSNQNKFDEKTFHLQKQSFSKNNENTCLKQIKNILPKESYKLTNKILLNLTWLTQKMDNLSINIFLEQTHKTKHE